jgi:hypothetical protein
LQAFFVLIVKISEPFVARFLCGDCEVWRSCLQAFFVVIVKVAVVSFLLLAFFVVIVKISVRVCKLHKD